MRLDKISVLSIHDNDLLNNNKLLLTLFINSFILII